MAANAEAITKAVPSMIGGATGAMLIEYNGQPLMVTITISSVGLFFGMIAAIGRAPKKDGFNRVQVALFNAGALWIAALWISFEVNTSWERTAIMSVAVGLAGQSILELLEQAGVATATWGKDKVIGFFKRVFGE